MAEFEGLFPILARIGIDRILDVGAHTGQFAQYMRCAGYTGQIVSFEPQAEAFAALERVASLDARWSVHRYALGDETGMRTLNVAASSFCSSFLAAEARAVTIESGISCVAAEDVEVRRLDDLFEALPELKVPAYTLLKVDVQGFGAQVIAGAQRSLQNIDAVLLEASMIPTYTGDNTVDQTIKMMRATGFHPVWIQQGWSNATTGQVFECDLLFYKTDNLP